MDGDGIGISLAKADLGKRYRHFENASSKGLIDASRHIGFVALECCFGSSFGDPIGAAPTRR